MLSKLLVPLDGSALSEQVLPMSTFLAKKLGSTITLLHTVDIAALQTGDPVYEHVGETETEILNPTSADADDALRSSMATAGPPEHHAYIGQLLAETQTRATAYLLKLAEGIAQEGIAVDTHVEVGEAAEAIVRYAEKEGCDLIAMSTHGRTGLARWRMGSVTDRVLRHTEKPLLIYRPGDEGQAPKAEVRKIILAVDGSPLAEQALPLAEELAGKLGVPVEPTYVVSTPTLAYADPLPYGGAEIAVDVQDAMSREAGTYLAKTVDRLKSLQLQAEPQLLHGDASAELVELISKTPEAMTVMTTHGRSGVGRFLLGSVTDKVVSRSGGPVLVIRANQG